MQVLLLVLRLLSCAVLNSIGKPGDPHHHHPGVSYTPHHDSQHSRFLLPAYNPESPMLTLLPPPPHTQSHSLSSKVCDLWCESSVEVHGAGQTLTLTDHVVSQTHPVQEGGGVRQTGVRRGGEKKLSSRPRSLLVSAWPTAPHTPGDCDLTRYPSCIVMQSRCICTGSGPTPRVGTSYIIAASSSSATFLSLVGDKDIAELLDAATIYEVPTLRIRPEPVHMYGSDNPSGVFPIGNVGKHGASNPNHHHGNGTHPH